MRFHNREIVERATRRNNQVVHDGNDHFRQNIQAAIDEQVERSVNRTRQAIFNGCENVISRRVVDGAKSGLECRARHKHNIFAEKFHGGLLAKGAAFSLKCHSRVFLDLHFLSVATYCDGSRAVSWFPFRRLFRRSRGAAASESIRAGSFHKFWPLNRLRAVPGSSFSCEIESPVRGLETAGSRLCPLSAALLRAPGPTACEIGAASRYQMQRI